MGDLVYVPRIPLDAAEADAMLRMMTITVDATQPVPDPSNFDPESALKTYAGYTDQELSIADGSGRRPVDRMPLVTPRIERVSEFLKPIDLPLNESRILVESSSAGHQIHHNCWDFGFVWAIRDIDLNARHVVGGNDRAFIRRQHCHIYLRSPSQAILPSCAKGSHPERPERTMHCRALVHLRLPVD